MNAGVSGEAHRDCIRRNSSDKSYNDANTGYSTAGNKHDISLSYSQDCTSIHQQSPLQKLATSSSKPQSRACSSFPQGQGPQGSNWRGPTVEPEPQAVDHDPQRDGPTFALGTTLGKCSCIPSVCKVKGQSTDNYLSTAPINKTSTTDNSINNANNPDNRVNNGHIEIGNPSSSVSAMTYANDITHFHIGTIQYHVCMPPEYLNLGTPLNDLGAGKSRNRAWKRRSKPRPNNNGRTMWKIFWCFY